VFVILFKMFLSWFYIVHGVLVLVHLSCA
jgi:hypothetical protein